MVAAISAPVFWNDDLRSGRTGRAHVTLTDGSQLYLGSNSTMRVLQHDAQAQQTSLDLLIGRLRGLVVKLSRPGSNFEIRTPVGVAGLAWLIHQKQNRSAECGSVTEERLGAPTWTGKEVCTAALLTSRTVFRNSSALSFQECVVEEA